MNIAFVHKGQNPMMLRWAVGYLNEALNAEGFTSDVVEAGTVTARMKCDFADVVVFYRTVDAESLSLMKRLKMMGKFLLYFIDDYIFQENCQYAPSCAHILSPFFETAHAIMSSNSVLLERVPVNKPKVLRRSVINRETFDILNPGQYISSAPNCRAIGWLAGVGRREMNSFVKQFLVKLDESLSLNERFTFVCFGNHGLGQQYKKIKVVEHPYIEPAKWHDLYRTYRSFAFSVVINPLNESDDFCKCKSELKYVETGAMMVPLVTSRVHPFTEVVREGENGFFASNPEEYVQKVLMVCRSNELARRVAETAHEHVKQEYNSIHNAQIFIADVKKALEEKGSIVTPEVKTTDLCKLEQFGNDAVGPVLRGAYLEMAVSLLPVMNISSISVLGGTYGCKVKTDARIQLWLNGQKKREQELPAASMGDVTWWKIEIPELYIGFGDTLTLRIINNDSMVNLAFFPCVDEQIGRARIGCNSVKPIAMCFEVKKK